MTLLNSAAMVAVATVIVPILIHLRKRRKSVVVDWPAMQFLTRTVATRRRGLTLEHLLLLLLRCLIIVLFVLAMARPAIEADRHAPKIMFFVLAGCGLLLLTGAVVTPWRLRSRILGVILAGLFLSGAGAMLTASPESLVDATPDRDIAIVIDSSMTMTLDNHGSTHFDLAISQAQSLVRTLSGNSTVSIIRGGPITQTVAGSPFRNLRKAEEVLATLSPVAGVCDLESAIQKATSLLQKAPNSRKQVLLLTDDQLCTWESVNSLELSPQSSESLAEADSPLECGTPDEVARAVLLAHVPESTKNISVDRILVDASIVTAGQPVPIEVEVRNGGSTILRDVAVKLLIDDREVATEPLAQIKPGVSLTVRFLHSFETATQHVVSGTVDIADLLPDDNRADSVIDVMPHLSVLVVNGNTDSDLAQRSATFAQLALDPTSLRSPQPDGDVAPLRQADAGRAIVTTAIEATRLDDIESLDEFQIVILCDVPRLPSEEAARIATFVEQGGGLWVIPDAHADTSFYDNWRVPLTDHRVMPAALRERDQWVGKSSEDGRITRLGVALDVAGRPFINDLFEQGGHDLADVSVLHFWRTTASESAVVGMRLTNGQALFVEQALGRGRVLIQNVSLSRRDSTFPATLGFPMLMHLWTYHLAASNGTDTNFEPTLDLVTELPALHGSHKRETTLQLVDPAGAIQDVPVSWNQDSAFAQIGNVSVPGVYRLRHKASESTVSSFAVHRDREESDLSVVSEERLQEISESRGIEFIEDVNQMATSSVSASAGTEIWDTLLFIVLWLLAAECVLVTWIRKRRGMNSVETPVSSEPNDRLSDVPLSEQTLEAPDLWGDASVSDPVAALGGAP